jgi:hypothetical protein
LTFQSANGCDNLNDICAKLKYPRTQVRTCGFTGHLNLSFQRVNQQVGNFQAFYEIKTFIIAFSREIVTGASLSKLNAVHKFTPDYY